MALVQEWLDKPVNLKKLIRHLQIDPDDLERAELEQAGWMLEASRYRVKKMKKRAMALIKAETERAQTGLKLRASKHEGAKMTEKEVADRTMLRPNVQEAKVKLEQAYVEEEWAKSIQAAYIQRASMLKILTEIRSTDVHNEIRQAKSQTAVDSMRREAERLRDRLEEGIDDDAD